MTEFNEDGFDEKFDRNLLEEFEEEDNSFIKLVSRNHPMFSNRSASISFVSDDGMVKTEKIATIPDDTIICDGCNDLIKDDIVGIYMLSPTHPWGTQCKKCIKEYFSEVPVVNEVV